MSLMSDVTEGITICLANEDAATTGTTVESEIPCSQPEQSNTITRTVILAIYWEEKSKLNPDSNLLSLS